MSILQETHLSESASEDNDENEEDEITISIDVQGGHDLGLDLVCASTSLRVTGVRAGPIFDFNLGSPDFQVMPGHVIVEVNGMRGSGSQLSQAIRAAQILKITFASKSPSVKGSQFSDSED